LSRRSVVLASVSLLVAASFAAWWWCSVETTPATASARAEERTEERVLVPVATASGGNADGAVDADRNVAEEFDDKHYVRIPARDLRIHVFDELDHTPIEGVTFRLDKYEVAGLPPLGTAVSASDGMATYTIPTDRRLHLTVESKSFTLDKVLVPDEPIGTPEQPLEIAFPRGASIHGRLFGTSGEPLSSDRLSLQTNAWDVVSMRLRTRRWRHAEERSRESAPDLGPNEFLFEDVPAEIDLVLTATYGEGTDERQQDSLTLYLAPGERREIEWNVGRRSSLSGRVVDDAGEPVAGATLAPSRSSEGRVFVEVMGSSVGQVVDGRVQKSDANGEFELRGLGAGPCILDVRSPDRRCSSGTYQCSLAPGEQRRDVVIELPRAAPLIVRARLPDGSVATSLLADVATAADRRVVNGQSTGGEDGTVTLEAVQLGEVEVGVSARVGATEWTGRARFLHDGEHDCVVDCTAVATLHGTVEFGPGKPANVGMFVTLIRRDEATEELAIRSGFHSPPGEFEFLRVRPGEYDVVAVTVDGWIGVVPSLSLAPGGQRDGVVVRVEPGTTLRFAAPSLEEGTARSLRTSDRYQIRVRRDGAVVATKSLSPAGHGELVVPPGKLTVELWSSRALLASRDVEARAFQVARVRF
jgi:hypothetical protein